MNLKITPGEPRATAHVRCVIKDTQDEVGGETGNVAWGPITVGAGFRHSDICSWSLKIAGRESYGQQVFQKAMLQGAVETGAIAATRRVPVQKMGLKTKAEKALKVGCLKVEYTCTGTSFLLPGRCEGESERGWNHLSVLSWFTRRRWWCREWRQMVRRRNRFRVVRGAGSGFSHWFMSPWPWGWCQLPISLKELDEVGAKVEKNTRHMHSGLKFRRAVWAGDGSVDVFSQDCTAQD